MPNIYETLEKNYIVFENSRIDVIFDENDVIWFSVKQILIALGYKDYKKTMKDRVDRKYVKKKVQINQNYTSGHPDSLYITESGLYKLMIGSRLPKAIRFADWIFDDVLPKVRKFGKYELKKNLENEMSELSKKINYLEKKNETFKNDLRKDTYPNGGVVYVIDFSDENKEVYRIGMTGNMNARKKLYDTHNLHNHNVVFIKQHSCPVQLESCIKSLLYDFRYKDKKDFFICSLTKIKNAFSKCENSIYCINKKNINKQIGGSKSNFIHQKNIIDSFLKETTKRRILLNNKINKLNNKLSY